MDLSSSSPVALANAAPIRALLSRGETFTLYSQDLSTLLSDLGRSGGALIVTPNLDHLRLLSRSAALRRAYRAADIMINDSRFLAKLCLGSRALCLPGSDLAPMMLDRAPAGAQVAVVGCDAAVQSHLARRYPHLGFAFFEPSMGFVRKRAERRAMAGAVLAQAPNLVFVCTGAPQSELFAAQLKRAGCEADMLCCGSAFHFLAGTKARAPIWARKLGGEWLWRFVLERRTRLRYAADAVFLARRAVAFAALRARGAANFGRYRIGI
jgi:N-acetylglucosaminyldiphosphoundecaprenol N-acetyl-beta-D-mannosaminyltransferase